MCGGTARRADLERAKAGLSPRVRGNLSKWQTQLGTGGSIPACAGEPRHGDIPDQLRRVYPRVCGGTRQIPRWPAVKSGLSPRVRGNRQARRQTKSIGRSIPACAGEPEPRVWHWRAASRSIPACAGEPTPRKRWTPPHGVYPRVCGGTVTRSHSTRWTPGLSPRVRGNRLFPRGHQRLPGSIPACAGEPRR